MSRLVYKTSELPTLLRLLSILNQKLGLSFWLTTFLNEHTGNAMLLMVPILTVLIPLAKSLPLPYTWFMRRHRELKALERSLETQTDDSALAANEAELERIDAAVRGLRVRLDFSDQFYDLRGHVDLIRKRLTEMRVQTVLEVPR